MFTIEWLGTNGQPTGHTTEADGAKTFAEAVWEATKLMRAVAKDSRDAMNMGDTPVGFVVRHSEAAA